MSNNNTLKIKRSEAEIRSDMFQLGAFLFSFQCPPQKEVIASKNSSKRYVDQWRTMERKGFLVTADGCLLPYSYYRKSCSGDKLEGHQRSAHFFLGREPDHTVKTNQWGWPCDEQVSHLCHNRDCVRPDHMVIEPRWKNVKRTFCGLSGSCDCGVVPQCIRTYRNPETFADTTEIEADKERVLELLHPLKELYSFKLEPRTKYKVEDTKRSNRNERKKATKRTEKQTRENSAQPPAKKVKKQ